MSTRTAPHLAKPELVTTTEETKDDFFAAIARGFHDTYDAEVWGPARDLFEPERNFGHRVDDRWVSSCGAYTREMATPGGSVPVAAVTVVTVAPGYRRRGLLTDMMRHQLTVDVMDRGVEPLALLWASESLIYGRFGYGRTTSLLSISGKTREMAFLPGVDLGDGSVDEVSVEEYLAAAPEARDRFFADRPGALARTEAWWKGMVHDPEAWRRGASARRFLLHFAADGTPDGFASFRTKWTDDGGEVMINDLDAATPQAYARLWRFLLDLDLIRVFRLGHAPTDEPLRQLVADQRAIKTELHDASYARLTDIPRSLAARKYTGDLDVVLDVADSFLPEVAGRFRVQAGPEGADVTRTDATADVALTVRDLATIYLGGTPLNTLQRAGLIDEHTPGSVQAISHAFSWPRAPFCPDDF
ncbi:GNAT family N-acetyltransferase [Microlunatus speluncae]|uniref:GNAT family N-acetyltransferase n=1 Tax=Microlunatus speluncae TaxID=2594267 RepID=UPI001375DF6E|nr:GNAT family N-acetyltransferase [Microlunatus speluncae]